MELEKRLEMINEENNCINDTVLKGCYILNHLLYDDVERREMFVLGELLPEFFQDIKNYAKEIENILRGF